MTDQTTNAAPAAKTGLLAALETKFESLIADIEAVPGEISEALQHAKAKVVAAWAHVEEHFDAAKTTAEADVAKVATDVSQTASNVAGATAGAAESAPAAAAPRAADPAAAAAAPAAADPSTASASTDASASTETASAGS
jgi:hypothetical protein